MGLYYPLPIWPRTANSELGSTLKSSVREGQCRAAGSLNEGGYRLGQVSPVDTGMHVFLC